MYMLWALGNHHFRIFFFCAAHITVKTDQEIYEVTFLIFCYNFMDEPVANVPSSLAVFDLSFFPVDAHER